MKYTYLILTILIMSLMYLACSRCYECTKKNAIINNGVVVDSSIETDKICTASSQEIADRESNGYTCNPE